MPAISTANGRDKSQGATFDVDDNVMSLIHQRNSLYANFKTTTSEAETTIAKAENACNNVNANDSATISILSESGLPLSELQLATRQVNEILTEVKKNQDQIEGATTEINSINNTNNYLIIGFVLLLIISGIFLARYSWAKTNPLKSTNAVSEQSDGIVPEVMSPPVSGQDNTPIVTDNYGTDTHLFSTNALCGGIGQQLNVTASASGNGKTSRDDSGNTITFTPDNTIDCLNDTAWRVAYSPNAHPYIEYTFATPIMVRKIGLIPGYNKIDSKTSTSRWEQNWRVKNATVIIEFVDKTSYTYQLSSLLDSNDMQITNLETDINDRSDIGFTLLANSVRIVIEDAYAPTAANPRNFVAISEVYIEGLTKDK